MGGIGQRLETPAALCGRKSGGVGQKSSILVHIAEIPVPVLIRGISGALIRNPPDIVDDTILPTVLFQVIRHVMGICHELCFCNSVTVAIVTVPPHRRSGINRFHGLRIDKKPEAKIMVMARKPPPTADRRAAGDAASFLEDLKPCRPSIDNTIMGIPPCAGHPCLAALKKTILPHAFTGRAGFSFPGSCRPKPGGRYTFRLLIKPFSNTKDSGPLLPAGIHISDAHGNTIFIWNPPFRPEK